METIKFLEEKAGKLFHQEYSEKRSACMGLTNEAFQYGKIQLESPQSAFYPILSYQDIEDLEPIDKQFVKNILRTARVTKLELPDFHSLVDKKVSKEYPFELWFGFGTDYESNCKLLFDDCKIKK